MATETATIRVPADVRDRLAAQARSRGISLAALLADFAWRSELEVMYESERTASRADAENPEAMAEQAEWESARLDGID